MADPEHIYWLCRGPKTWNAWRRKHPFIRPDLTGVTLTLSQRQLGPEQDGPINFTSTDLRGADLRHAMLAEARFEDAILASADLLQARLNGANFARADLTNTVLDEADLAGAVLDKAILDCAQLQHAVNLTQEQIEQAIGNQTTMLPAHLTMPDRWLRRPYHAPDWSDAGAGDFVEPELQDDLYARLGLKPWATAEEIRSAYLVLAKDLHPDRRPHDSHAEERFKAVSSAFAILKDPEKRKRYDDGLITAEGYDYGAEYDAAAARARGWFFYVTAGVASTAAVAAAAFLILIKPDWMHRAIDQLRERAGIHASESPPASAGVPAKGKIDDRLSKRSPAVAPTLVKDATGSIGEPEKPAGP